MSSLQHKYYNALSIFLNRYSKQIQKMFKNEDQSFEHWLSALGRTYNGHTALMVGKNRKVEKSVGWDPLSAAEAFMKSTLQGYPKMPPLEGQWHNDAGMDGDPTAAFFGTSIDEYERFKTFITQLVGKSDICGINHLDELPGKDDSDHSLLLKKYYLAVGYLMLLTDSPGDNAV